MVLVVDDSPEDAAVVERLIRLAEPNCDITICNDGEHALEWLWRRTPNLVLLDVAMPGMDGVELLQRVRQNPCITEFPVVVVSGKLAPRDVAAFRRAGADGVVQKGVEQSTFAQQLLAAARPWLRREG